MFVINNPSYPWASAVTRKYSFFLRLRIQFISTTYNITSINNRNKCLLKSDSHKFSECPFLKQFIIAGFCLSLFTLLLKYAVRHQAEIVTVGSARFHFELKQKQTFTFFPCNAAISLRCPSPENFFFLFYLLVNP